MPTKFQKNPYVRCPCFYRETPMEIKCKDRGDLPGGSGLAGEATVTCFPSKDEKRSYKEDFCNGCFGGCEIFRAFDDMTKYRNQTE